MITFSQLAGIIAGLVTFLAFVPYTIAIIKRETKPQRATWIIWATAGLVILLSYHFSGAIETIWVALTYFVLPCFIMLLSIKYGVGGWTTLDKICLALVGISMILWFVLKAPPVALFLNIFVDALGLLPTIVKTYKNPGSESSVAWGLSFSGNLINILAITQFTIPVVIYPVYMVLNTGTIFILSSFLKKKIIS